MRHSIQLNWQWKTSKLTSEGLATSFSSTYFAHGPKKPSILDASFSLNFFLFSIFFWPVSNTVKPTLKKKSQIWVFSKEIYTHTHTYSQIYLKHKINPIWIQTYGLMLYIERLNLLGKAAFYCFNCSIFQVLLYVKKKRVSYVILPWYTIFLINYRPLSVDFTTFWKKQQFNNVK